MKPSNKAGIQLELSRRSAGLQRLVRAGGEAANSSHRGGEQKGRGGGGCPCHTPGIAVERSSVAPAAGHETDESEISGTMGSAGSAGTGTCRHGDMPGQGRAGMGPRGCRAPRYHEQNLLRGRAQKQRAAMWLLPALSQREEGNG